MKSFIVILALCFGLFAQDSVLTQPKTIKSGIFTTVITSYDTKNILLTIGINAIDSSITVSVPSELLPYIERDTSNQKNVSPFMFSSLRWSKKQLGADSAQVIKLIQAMNKNLKKQITLK